MFCPNCACELPAVAKYCVRCGARIETVLLSPSVPPPPAVVPLAQAVQATALDPKRANFLDVEIKPLHVYAAGNNFVMPRDSILPSRCVKCGNPAAERWMTTTFSWHHPGYYFFIISPILYVIVALIVRKRIKVAVPLCAAHRSIRVKRLWIGGLLLVACIPIPVTLAMYIENEAGQNLAIWLGFALFIAGLFFLACATPLRATHIGSSSAEFKGAGRDFLAQLDPAPEDSRIPY